MISPERIAELRRLLGEDNTLDSITVRGTTFGELLDEIERLRAVIRETCRDCPVLAHGPHHLPGCRIYEIEP